MDEKEKEFNKDNIPATNETDTSLSEMKKAVTKSIEEQEDTLKTMDELSKKYADDVDMKDTRLKEMTNSILLRKNS